MICLKALSSVFMSLSSAASTRVIEDYNALNNGLLQEYHLNIELLPPPII
jgi:hypothetical protein